MTVFWGPRSGYGGAAVAAAAQAAEATGKARGARRRVEELESRLDRSMLACEAMWTLLRDKLGVTDIELIDRIHEIDLSDGQLDGKVRRGAVSCPKCSRTISPRFPKCMYCGQPVMHDPFA